MCHRAKNRDERRRWECRPRPDVQYQKKYAVQEQDGPEPDGQAARTGRAVPVGQDVTGRVLIDVVDHVRPVQGTGPGSVGRAVEPVADQVNEDR